MGAQRSARCKSYVWQDPHAAGTRDACLPARVRLAPRPEFSSSSRYASSMSPCNSRGVANSVRDDGSNTPNPTWRSTPTWTQSLLLLLLLRPLLQGKQSVFAVAAHAVC